MEARESNLKLVPPSIHRALSDAALRDTYCDRLAGVAELLVGEADSAAHRGLYGLEEALRGAAASAESWSEAYRRGEG